MKSHSGTWRMGCRERACVGVLEMRGGGGYWWDGGWGVRGRGKMNTESEGD